MRPSVPPFSTPTGVLTGVGAVPHGARPFFAPSMPAPASRPHPAAPVASTPVAEESTAAAPTVDASPVEQEGDPPTEAGPAAPVYSSFYQLLEAEPDARASCGEPPAPPEPVVDDVLDGQAADVRFPTLEEYSELVGGAEPQSGGVAEVRDVPGETPESWEPVPESPRLPQIVEQVEAAATNDAAAVAEIIERVAERVRRGELTLPVSGAEGEASALAIALAAILQPGRR